jgi:DNA-binding CsgD family transcriptional regulator
MTPVTPAAPGTVAAQPAGAIAKVLGRLDLAHRLTGVLVLLGPYLTARPRDVDDPAPILVDVRVLRQLARMLASSGGGLETLDALLATAGPYLTPTRRDDERHRVTSLHAAHASLTEREGEVLARMSIGMSNAEIGRSLYLAEDTVKSHARRLFRKLGARDRAHAVRRGFELEYLSASSPADSSRAAS